MYQKICSIALLTLLGTYYGSCSAQNAVPKHTPFEPYVQVAEKVFVYDKSLFSPYTGPDVSHWELKVPHSANEVDHDYDRKRLGIVTLTPTLQAYLDVLWSPMSEYFELRDTKSNKLIHSFEYYGAAFGLLLFSGQGAVYEFRQPELLCHGSTTNKYVYRAGKLFEVVQPVHFLNDGETTAGIDLQLMSEPEHHSAQVASIPKGAKVTVLSFKHSSEGNPDNSWYLIKTPLGLTGWVSGGLEITFCN